MPVLSPVVWIVLVAAFLQCLTGLGWMITSHKLDKSLEATRRCNAEHQAFVMQTRIMGDQARAKAKQIETEQKRIADETARSWAANLDYVRADAARRVRLAAARSAGGSGMSATPQAGLTPPAASADAIPAPERVAADCAETTLTANFLQAYLEKLNITAAEPWREKHE